MCMDSLTIDSTSRDKIVKEIFQNFFVEAGAGSGKTTMLVNRMVAMVEAGVPIEKICAITFTKAAANEFYERFQKALSERANPDYEYKAEGYAGELPAPTEETRVRCQEALNSIDLCFMGTIDAFCYMLLTEHPTEARIPSNASLLMENDIRALYKQEYVRICKGEHGKELAELAKNFRCLHSDPEEVFLKVITLLMNNRNVRFNYNETKDLDIDKSFKQDREDLIRILGVIAKHKECIYLGNDGSRSSVDAIEDTANAVRRTWSVHFVSVFYSIKNILGLQLNKDAMDVLGFGDEDIFNPAQRAIKLTLDAENGIFTRLENLQYDGTMTFAMKCVPIIESAIREKGAITFFDSLYYLRNMLKRDAEQEGKLINYIYNRHSFFLIDEFQDTNPMQAEVFFYLTSKNPKPDWTSCVPKPGSMFIVGDPKQSIYRFRGADVCAFLNVKGLFTGEVGEVLMLSRNFRSTTQMCEYYNDRFKVMLPEQNKNQSKFEDIPLPDDKWGTELQGTYKYGVYTGGPEGDGHDEELDTLQVGKIIQRLVGNPKYTIRDKGDKEPRAIRYSDFMLISKSKKQLPGFMKHFDELGIPYKVEGKVPFYDCPALNEIYSIYATVADSKDQISLYATLSGMVFGFTQDELLVYRDAGKAISINNVNEDESDSELVKAIKSAVLSLKKLSLEAKALSPSALFEKIMADFQIYRFVDSRNLEVVYYTLELLREAEKAGVIVSLKDGVAYIKELLDGTNEVERCLNLKEEENVVHIANLHKVKGLEAPIIILSYAAAKTPGPTIRIEHGDTAAGYIFGLEKDGDAKGYYISTGHFSDKKDEEKESIKAEQTRLSYVGATRARNALIICDSHYWKNNKNGGGYVAYSAWKTLMENGVKDFFDEIDENTVCVTPVLASTKANELYDKAATESVLNDRAAESDTYAIMRPSLVAHSKMEEEIAVDISESFDTGVLGDTKEVGTSAVHRFPTLLGTMIHKLMEILVSTKNMARLDSAVGEILSEFLSEEALPYEASFKTTLLKVGNTMRDCGYAQENALPQLILQEMLDADEVYCEVPFCYKNASELWNGVMDAIYLKDGKWHIIDYKTNLDGRGLDKLYENQLDAYKKAFKAMTGEDADAFTYHIAV